MPQVPRRDRSATTIQAVCEVPEVRRNNGGYCCAIHPAQPAEVGELVEALREVRGYTDSGYIIRKIDAALAKLEGKA